jgi:transcriptional regulator with XRE-family HTH domain
MGFRRDLFRAELARTRKRPVHIAVELEVDPRTVARWLEMNGRIDPTPGNARRLARYFGHDEDYFLSSHDLLPAA